MDVRTLKNKMGELYVEMGNIETKLSSLMNELNIINMVRYNNNTPIIEDLIRMVKQGSDDTREIYNFTNVNVRRVFNEYNKASNNIINKFDSTYNELQGLKQSSKELDYLYEYYGDEKVLTTYLELEHRLKSYLPNVSRLKNDVMLYKLMIDFNNKKITTPRR